MRLQYFLVYMLLRTTGSTLIDGKNDATFLNRTGRDLTGQYHPELHGDHGHRHSHSHVGVHDHGNDGFEVVSIQSTSGNHGEHHSTVVKNHLGYEYPPLPPVEHPTTDAPGTPNGYANCGCVVKGQCAPKVVAGMEELLKGLKNDVVCGLQYSLCCYDDPWPGPIDTYKPIAPCIPIEHCGTPYGSSPYDIQNFGVLGPCLGLGSVRCLDNKPTPPGGPTTYIVPIYQPTPAPQPLPGYEYVPPPTTPSTTTTTPPPVHIPPPTEPPTTVGYDYAPPPTEPLAVVYEVPLSYYEPPVSYGPPSDTYDPPVEVSTPVEIYEAPVPVDTYEPPTPVDTYVPPKPVDTYEPPTPVDTYVPPKPVDTYEPPKPVDTYEPPKPVDTYEPPKPVVPTNTYQVPVSTPALPPTTNYGRPSVGTNLGWASPYGSSSLGSRFPYGGYYSRYGYPALGYGLGFRKSFHFSKGFYG